MFYQKHYNCCAVTSTCCLNHSHECQNAKNELWYHNNWKSHSNYLNNIQLRTVPLSHVLGGPLFQVHICTKYFCQIEKISIFQTSNFMEEFFPKLKCRTVLERVIKRGLLHEKLCPWMIMIILWCKPEHIICSNVCKGSS